MDGGFRIKNEIMGKFIKSKFFIYALMPMWLACEQESKKELPDVSQIEVTVQVRRFEKDLFAMTPPLTEEDWAGLYKEYPDFLPLFVDKVLGMEGHLSTTSDKIKYLEGFITFPELMKLREKVEEDYQDFSEFEQSFQRAFQYYLYYFPEAKVPSITTYLSEYNVAAFIYGQNQLAVGLDFFLGKDYPYREKNPNNPSFSDYLTQNFNQDYLVSKTLLPLIEDLVGYGPGHTLLELMIQEGKKLYLLDQFLPAENDTVIIEVNLSEWEWLNQNEFNIWSFFLEEELLYNSEWRKIRKYVEYSPNSPGMPEEAPGRTGAFIGWKIIQQYMKRHPELSCEDLLELNDAQLILSESRYRPRRQ
jgi:hypothetical protein